MAVSSVRVTVRVRVIRVMVMMAVLLRSGWSRYRCECRSASLNLPPPLDRSQLGVRLPPTVAACQLQRMRKNSQQALQVLLRALGTPRKRNDERAASGERVWREANAGDWAGESRHGSDGEGVGEHQRNEARCMLVDQRGESLQVGVSCCCPIAEQRADLWRLVANTEASPTSRKHEIHIPIAPRFHDATDLVWLIGNQRGGDDGVGRGGEGGEEVPQEGAGAVSAGVSEGGVGDWEDEGVSWGDGASQRGGEVDLPVRMATVTVGARRVSSSSSPGVEGSTYKSSCTQE